MNDDYAFKKIITESINDIKENIRASLFSESYKIVKAIIEAYDCSLEEALEREDDVIVLDLDEPSYFELGYAYVDMMGGAKELTSTTLETYFDYEAFGRDLVLVGEFTITKDGKGVSLI